MAREIVKAALDNQPLGNKLTGRQTYACPHFSGSCLGDGCINWTPVGSPPGQQNAQCLLERACEPVHTAECERKAANADRWAKHYDEYAADHGAAGARVNAAIYRHIARDWRRIAETAPTRAAIAKARGL